MIDHAGLQTSLLQELISKIDSLVADKMRPQVEEVMPGSEGNGSPAEEMHEGAGGMEGMDEPGDELPPEVLAEMEKSGSVNDPEEEDQRRVALSVAKR